MRWQDFVFQSRSIRTCFTPKRIYDFTSLMIDQPAPPWHETMLSGKGIDEIWKMIEAYRAHTQENGFFEKQRQQQARNWMLHTIEHHLRVHFFAHPGVKKAMARIEKQVMAGKISSFTAAQKLLAIFQDAEEA